jgi:predicted phosphodiesterase
MVHAILSDVHANLPALSAVLIDAARCGAAHVTCLGDLVGYHADVHATIALLRERRVSCVAGNHDLMAIGRLPHAGGPLARSSAAWTARELTAGERAFLEALPLMLHLADGTVLVHALPWSTETRLRSPRDFAEAVEGCRTASVTSNVCFTGHTHVAAVVHVDAADRVTESWPSRFARHLGASGFWFVNPGSVGHPRDGDRAARYVLYDDVCRTVRFRRVRYDARPTLERDAAHGFAAPPAPRLRAHRARDFVRALVAPMWGNG